MAESPGERRISKILTELKIPFTTQWSDETCRHKGILKFDFAFTYDKRFYLGEFQGSQHYFFKRKYGGIPELKEQFHRDWLKQYWCSKRGIPLLIIPHWMEKQSRELIIDFIGWKP